MAKHQVGVDRVVAYLKSTINSAPMGSGTNLVLFWPLLLEAASGCGNSSTGDSFLMFAVDEGN